MIRFIQTLRKIFYTYRAKKTAVRYGTNLRVNGKSFFSGKIYFGNNNNFNGMQVLGKGTVYFGDNFHSGIECMIITENHNYEGKTIPYDDTYIEKTIIIEDNVWLGNRVTIIGNVTIGEGAIVAAGSVVSKDIPKFSIVGGNPVRIIKYRNCEHYNLLKSQKKFF